MEKVIECLAEKIRTTAIKQLDKDLARTVMDNEWFITMVRDRDKYNMVIIDTEQEMIYDTEAFKEYSVALYHLFDLQEEWYEC